MTEACWSGSVNPMIKWDNTETDFEHEVLSSPWICVRWLSDKEFLVACRYARNSTMGKSLENESIV
jgi:hypothetical protein